MDKFEMLEAVGRIDEKYVKKADKLIKDRAEIDRQVIKLKPEKRKFSWKTFAAAAASVAVLVTGTLIAVKFSESAPIEHPEHLEPPAKVILTEEQQSYLDKWRTKISPVVDITYAVSRLHFTEIELPEDVTGKRFIDENRAVFIREETQTLEIYNIKEKTYTIAAKFDKSPYNNWGIVRADKDYVLFQHLLYDGGWLADELYLYDVGAGEVRNIYTTETEDDLMAGDTIIADGRVYFTVYEDYWESDIGEIKPTLHVYDIKKGREVSPIKNAGNPKYYNGKLFYWRYKNREPRFRSSSGGYDLDTSALITKFGIFGYETGCTRFKNLETDEYIFYANHNGNKSFGSDDISDFAIKFESESTLVSETENNVFMYYAPTNEILVFQDGDGFGEPVFFGWGGYISRTEPDGTVKEYIFSDKEGEDNVEIPIFEPETEDPDPKKQYLNDVRRQLNVNDSVGVEYARDRLSVVEFSFPWETIFAVDQGTLFTDSDHALVSDNTLMNKIEMYTLDTGEYTLLLSAESDPFADGSTRYQIYYTTADYIVFSRISYDAGTRDLCLMQLKKGGYPVIELGEDNSGYLERMFIYDNKLYYASNSSTAPVIYRYEVGAEKPEVYLKEGVPLCVYDDQLLYYTMADGALYMDIQGGVDNADLNKRVIHSTRKGFKLAGEPYTENMWACRNGVFKVDGGKLINCISDEVIISSEHDMPFYPRMQPDFGVVIGGYVGYIYNANTNELLVFEENDDVNDGLTWANCRWGICRDGALISRFENAKPMNDHDISYADMGIPDVYVTTNEDVGHPLNIWLDIDPESISVVQSDDLPYGFTQYVEEDKLKFTMNIAMKENFYDYDQCDIWMEKHSFTLKRGEVAQLPMTMEDGGQFSITLLNDTEQVNFGSTFHFALELNSSITCEIFYMEAYRGEREF